MGAYYSLINATKKEQLSFTHVNAAKAREMPGNPASAAIVTWYLIKNRGDYISFITDEDIDCPIQGIDIREILNWPDVTDRVIDELINEEILGDFGKSYIDEDDPDNIYLRDLRNIWGNE